AAFLQRVPRAWTRLQPLGKDDLLVALREVVRGVLAVNLVDGRESCRVVVFLKRTATRTRMDDRRKLARPGVRRDRARANPGDAKFRHGLVLTHETAHAIRLSGGRGPSKIASRQRRQSDEQP